MAYGLNQLMPKTEGDFRNWLQSELKKLADETAYPRPVLLQLSVLNAAPSKIADGMVAIADGVNWNPGGGAGIYARIAGAWVKL